MKKELRYINGANTIQMRWVPTGREGTSDEAYKVYVYVFKFDDMIGTDVMSWSEADELGADLEKDGYEKVDMATTI